MLKPLDWKIYIEYEKKTRVNLIESMKINTSFSIIFILFLMTHNSIKYTKVMFDKLIFEL